jgi:hypothetical protein
MPWARIPPDKLIHLPLFGIDIVVADDGDYFWVRGPLGRERVSKKMPRVWFDTVEDAHQAGATAIRIRTTEEAQEYDNLLRGMDEGDAADEAPGEPSAE